MSNNKELTSTLLSIVFPQEFIDNFEIVDIQKDEFLGVLTFIWMNLIFFLKNMPV